MRRALVLPLLLSVLALCGCDTGGHAAPPPPASSVGEVLHAALPASIRTATLRDSSGAAVSLASLRGKVVVLSDMLTLCQETCPLDTANVVAAARAVERAGLGRQVVFLSVTVDPQRDTQSRLAAYRRLYDPAPRDWHTLTGAPGGLRSFWKGLGVFVQREPNHPPLPHDWLTGQPLDYDVTHSDALIFLDRTGRERFVLQGTPQVAANAPIPARLRRFLDHQGRGNLAHPGAGAWTLPQVLDVVSWLAGRRV